MVSVEGFEPPLLGPKPRALPGYAIRRKLAPQTRIERVTERLTAVCSTSELLGNKLGAP
jgi:hypothetical protein